jgi:hypothetical protein
MRNKELVNKRFEQIDSKLKTLKYMLSRQTGKREFLGEIDNIEGIVNDLRSLIERDSSPLRNG